MQLTGKIVEAGYISPSMLIAPSRGVILQVGEQRIAIAGLTENQVMELTRLMFQSPVAVALGETTC